MAIASIYHYYKTSFAASKKWIWFMVWLFLAAAIIGFFVFNIKPDLIESIVNYFKDLVGSSQQNNQALVVIIFKQNITTSLMALLGGIAFGLLPLGTVLVNGFLLGFVIHYLFRILPVAVSTKIFIVVATLLPHGIFELPIVLISASLGLKWGLAWLSPSAKGNRKQVWKAAAREALLFIPLLAVVLAIAALLEVFVSGRLADMLAAGLQR